MTNYVKILYFKFRNLILYGIIGCCSSGLDFLLYTLFVQVFGWHYILSNCISVLAGITTSFTLNKAKKCIFCISQDVYEKASNQISLTLEDLLSRYNNIDYDI